jgi:hypothetical protein
VDVVLRQKISAAVRSAMQRPDVKMRHVQGCRNRTLSEEAPMPSEMGGNIKYGAIVYTED